MSIVDLKIAEYTDYMGFKYFVDRDEYSGLYWAEILDQDEKLLTVTADHSNRHALAGDIDWMIRELHVGG